jgi:hypothetical protein
MVFSEWSQPRNEALILLFAEMFPRVYIEDLMLRKLNINAAVIMPEGFNLNDKFDK